MPKSVIIAGLATIAVILAGGGATFASPPDQSPAPTPTSGNGATPDGTTEDGQDDQSQEPEAKDQQGKRDQAGDQNEQERKGDVSEPKDD
ncbi:hypothetical protein [Nonomuraea sp. NPDC049784]|uniref:hypothetical protein n=1 Tax=Nonomuraea sp. NPDC049784 TaxID=3154361 RepID=UPI003400EB48